MNNKREEYLFYDFENIMLIGEIPTTFEQGYTYLEQVLLLRKWIKELRDYALELDKKIETIKLQVEENTKNISSLTDLVNSINNAIVIKRNDSEEDQKAKFEKIVNLFENNKLVNAVFYDYTEGERIANYYMFKGIKLEDLTSAGGRKSANITFSIPINVKIEGYGILYNTLENDITFLCDYDIKKEHIETIMQRASGLNYTIKDTNSILGKNNTTPFTPVKDYQPATKIYVDTKVNNAKHEVIDSLPIASKTSKGIVQIGENLSITEDGSVDLPIASSTTLGGIKVGSNLSITPEGVLNATGGSSNNPIYYYQYNHTYGEFNDTSSETLNLFNLIYNDLIANKHPILIVKRTNAYNETDNISATIIPIIAYNKMLIRSAPIYVGEHYNESVWKEIYLECTITENKITSVSEPLVYNFGKYLFLTQTYNNSDYNYHNGNFTLTTNNEKAYTPTADYHPATKKYVDDNKTKRFSFDFLFTDDDIDTVSNYNVSVTAISNINKTFNVNDTYGELMCQYMYKTGTGDTPSEVIIPADGLKEILGNVSDVDYTISTLPNGNSQIMLRIKRTDDNQPFTSPVNFKLVNIFLNGYFLDSTSDISESINITKTA